MRLTASVWIGWTANKRADTKLEDSDRNMDTILKHNKRMINWIREKEECNPTHLYIHIYINFYLWLCKLSLRKEVERLVMVRSTSPLDLSTSPAFDTYFLLNSIKSVNLHNPTQFKQQIYTLSKLLSKLVLPTFQPIPLLSSEHTFTHTAHTLHMCHL